MSKDMSTGISKDEIAEKIQVDLDESLNILRRVKASLAMLYLAHQNELCFAGHEDSGYAAEAMGLEVEKAMKIVLNSSHLALVLHPYDD